MPKKIQDEFTSVKLSPQIRYQLRQGKKGLCAVCLEKQALGSKFCSGHSEKKRKYAADYYRNKSLKKG